MDAAAFNVLNDYKAGWRKEASPHKLTGLDRKGVPLNINKKYCILLCTIINISRKPLNSVHRFQFIVYDQY